MGGGLGVRWGSVFSEMFEDGASSMSTLYLFLVSGSGVGSVFGVVISFLRFTRPMYCHSLGCLACVSSRVSLDEEKSG